jgi:hypothetical protein
MCIEQGIAPEHIAFAAAAAIRYDHSADSAAERLQIMRKHGGIEAVLREICNLEPTSKLAQLILEGDKRLQHEGWVEQDT